MANQILTSGLSFYQSANASAEQIKENFIIRVREFDIIMDDIRRNTMEGSIQHYLLQGRRGSGKSTLLKRIQVEIETDDTLKEKYIAINPAEEQANIYKFCDLLETIIEELEYKGISIEIPEWKGDENSYAQSIYNLVHEALEKAGKKIILLLDNIDRVLENLKDENNLVREILLNYKDIKIIGGSTVMTEHFWSYNAPFYQFFRVMRLESLTIDEMKQLLLLWSEKLNIPQLKQFVENKPGQLETIRILTDGLPRTLQFFVDILLDNTNGTGYEYLKRIMDYMTPLYQERLNNLPAAQRKIVLQMAFLWEGTGTKEISEASRMEAKTVSAQLKQLADKGIVEKLPTKTKNHLYRLTERFFNLWLIFTQGSPKEKRKAKYLTIFLESFYDAEELKALAEGHLKILEERKLNPDKAALLSKAYAQSRYISYTTRNELIEKTLSLENIPDELKIQMPSTTADIAKNIELALSKGDLKKALKLAKDIEQEDGIKENAIAIIYSNINRKDLAENYYLQAIEKGDKIALYNLGNLYRTSNRFDLAENYYLQAIENKIEYAANNLGNIYQLQGKYTLAEKFFLISIENGNEKAMYNIGNLYMEQGKFDLAEKYYLQATKSGQQNAVQKLAMLYVQQGKFNLAESYLLQAIKNGYGREHYNLSLLYYTMGDKLKAINHIKEYEVISYKDAALRIIINVWNGELKEIENNVMKFIHNIDEIDFLDFLFTNIIVHHQINLVQKLFKHPDFGEDLIAKLQPLYYAVQKLSGEDENIDLKIPVELKETVADIINTIHVGQEFYYGEN